MADKEPVEVPLPRIYERDIDVLLREELLFNAAVQQVFTKALSLPASTAILNCRLSVVDTTGETDVHAELDLGDGTASLLIENKIDAIFQPRQPERYKERAAVLIACRDGHRAFCVLVAPSSYASARPTDAGYFDAVVSYEDICAAIASEGTGRSLDRAAMLERAVSKAKAAYIAVPDAAVTTFWQRVYDIASVDFPELQMAPPKERGAESHWLSFKPSLPTRITLDWKVKKSVVGLSFWPTAVIVPDAGVDLTSIPFRAVWRMAGRTATIEITTTPPPRDSWADLPYKDVRDALVKASALLVFYREHLSR